MAANKSEPAKRGRPPIRPNPLDPGIVDRICEGLVAGETITKVCEPEDMPHFTMVYRAMAKDEDFANAIAKARAAQQEAEIDKMIDIADSATAENVSVAKLRIWARQWRAMKLSPKKYGEKVQAEVTGANGGPIQTQAIVVDATQLEPAQREALKLALMAAKEKKG